jgi:hypothetical protein
MVHDPANVLAAQSPSDTKLRGLLGGMSVFNARAAERTSQGPHRAVGTRVSAFCASWPADRLPARDAALVGLLAQGHRYRRDG